MYNTQPPNFWLSMQLGQQDGPIWQAELQEQVRGHWCNSAAQQAKTAFDCGQTASPVEAAQRHMSSFCMAAKPARHVWQCSMVLEIPQATHTTSDHESLTLPAQRVRSAANAGHVSSAWRGVVLMRCVRSAEVPWA